MANGTTISPTTEAKGDIICTSTHEVTKTRKHE